MKRSITKITMKSDYADVLFDSGRIERVQLTQPKYELYKSAEKQVDILQKAIKKNMKFGWSINGLILIIALLVIINKLMPTAILLSVVSANLTAITMLAAIIAFPFNLESLIDISRRDKLTQNIDSIAAEIDKYKNHNVSNDYFMNIDLSTKSAEVFSNTIKNLRKELRNNPKKVYNAAPEWDNEVIESYEEPVIKNEKVIPEDGDFEMVKEVPTEEAFVKVLRR